MISKSVPKTKIKKTIHLAPGENEIKIYAANNEAGITAELRKVVYNAKENWFPDSLRIRFSWFDDKPIDEYFGIPIILNLNGKRTWLSHPDSTVDLACLSIMFLKGDIGIEKRPILPYSQFAKDDDIYQGAQIFVLGYPESVGPDFWTQAMLR